MYILLHDGTYYKPHISRWSLMQQLVVELIGVSDVPVARLAVEVLGAEILVLRVLQKPSWVDCDRISGHLFCYALFREVIL